MRDLRSLDSARESFQENFKKEKFSSPEMGEDFKSLSNFVLDQDDSATLRRQNTERVVRSRAESFSDQDTKNLDQKINPHLRSSYDSIMNAKVGTFEEPEPDGSNSALRKPTRVVNNYNLPPIIKPSTQRQLERRKTIQYKRKSTLLPGQKPDFDVLSCSGVSSTQEKLDLAREE